MSQYRTGGKLSRFNDAEDRDALQRYVESAEHGRYPRTWRWERPLNSLLGSHWSDLAADTSAWRESLDDMACWRQLHA